MVLGEKVLAHADTKANLLLLAAGTEAGASGHGASGYGSGHGAAAFGGVKPPAKHRKSRKRRRHSSMPDASKGSGSGGKRRAPHAQN